MVSREALKQLLDLQEQSCTTRLNNKMGSGYHSKRSLSVVVLDEEIRSESPHPVRRPVFRVAPGEMGELLLTRAREPP